MQRHTPIHLKEARLQTESAAAGRSARRKAPHPSVNKKSKPKAEPFNFDKFMNRLKLENIKTERFVSPSKTLQQVFDRERRNNSSKSRSHHATKSIETSRDKSGDTYRRTMKQKERRSRSRGLHPKVSESLKVLELPRGLQFRELATEMFNRFGEVEKKLKPSSKRQDLEGTRAAHQLSVRYREIFGTLIKSMINELNSLSDQKQSQILNSVESITTLQNSILQKQGELFDLQDRMNMLQDQLDSSRKLLRQQNSFIIQMSKKESRVSRLLYAIRKRGVDIDRIYIDDVQTPIDDSGLTEQSQPDDRQQEESEEQQPQMDRQLRFLNQSY